jgi:hypothetical protein
MNDPLFSDIFTCPECKLRFERPVRLRGIEWKAFVEDHLSECERKSPVRLNRKVQASPDRELRAFVLARLSNVHNMSRHSREVIAEHGCESIAFESSVVYMLSELMEIEKRVLKARNS